ncbi:protein GID8 homolog isoform X1 [Primulina tabacum]|uniref:protein GID8 homolog isoform X1 n=1 Tax=Primulina tabacum TaxID=48773 RepID=UPI003F5A9FA3
MAESKKVIGMDEWKRKLQAVNVRKEDMNKLVMNFLVTEGFADAAEKFRLESGTNRIFFHVLFFFLVNLHVLMDIFDFPYPNTADIELTTVTDRMVVKKAVQNGHVVDAIKIVHNLNPEILKENPKALFSLLQQLFIELIRAGKTEEALMFAQEKLGPLAEENRFLVEFERTFSLLILHNVANSSVSDLLKMSQRNKTANNVNEAMLISQANEKETKLSSLLKMLAWVDKELEKEVAYPKMKDFSTCKLEDPAAI